METRFIVHNADGNEYTLICKPRIHHIIPTRTEISGKRGAFWTSDGRPVNRIDKGFYEILEPGRPNVPVTSDDPDAP